MGFTFRFKRSISSFTFITEKAATMKTLHFWKRPLFQTDAGCIKKCFHSFGRPSLAELTNPHSHYLLELMAHNKLTQKVTSESMWHSVSFPYVIFGIVISWKKSFLGPSVLHDLRFQLWPLEIAAQPWVIFRKLVTVFKDGAPVIPMKVGIAHVFLAKEDCCLINTFWELSDERTVSLAKPLQYISQIFT